MKCHRAIRIFALSTALAASAIVHARTVPQAEIVPIASASRTIAIEATTRWVNVTEHENVAFESSGGRFAASFDRADRTFGLNEIAPTGMLDHAVVVYVAPDPLYLQ